MCTARRRPHTVVSTSTIHDLAPCTPPAAKATSATATNPRPQTASTTAWRPCRVATASPTPMARTTVSAVHGRMPARTAQSKASPSSDARTLVTGAVLIPFHGRGRAGRTPSLR